jgi:PPOX class probable F420-dependent enzyme
VWISRDGDDLLVSTIVGRRKHRNITADPRVGALVFSKEAPYTYVEVRGTATMTPEGGRELIDTHARTYQHIDRFPWDDGTDNVRVVIRITADLVVMY